MGESIITRKGGAVEVEVESDLYVFSSHTFTNATATGTTGPTLAQCRTAYSAASWTQNNSFFNMTTQGIQEWKVPATGSYTIQVAGASGASGTNNTYPGGTGTIMTGTFSLTEGEVLKILVGQAGFASGSYAGGGGGGSFVVRSPYNTLASCIIAAGGGGGGASSSSGTDGYGVNASTGTVGTADRLGWNTTQGSQGTVGNGGVSGGGNSNSGGGGGGFLTSGVLNSSNSNSGAPGNGFLQGGAGGKGGGPDAGGFGGGGSTPTGLSNSNCSAGGGGGYSGGAGGQRGAINSNRTGGGGGGSYNSGTNQSNSVGNSGHGYVTITKL
jgi:hypothetical protein